MGISLLPEVVVCRAKMLGSYTLCVFNSYVSSDFTKCDIGVEELIYWEVFLKQNKQK